MLLSEPRTVRAVVEYDGTAFSGMQVQPSVRTVAGVLEAALQKHFKTRTPLTSAGRTDAGVHATGQVVSFKAPEWFPLDRLAIALNSELPADAAVRDIADAGPGFSARFSAVERTYVYAVFLGRAPSPLLARYAFHVWRTLDLERFRSGAQQLIGEHDFRSFCGMLPQSGPTVRTVRAITCERRGDLLRVEIRADGFLHRMVRNIVGTLVDCAAGKRDPETIPAILAARDRAAAGLTAPAHGLYLAGVRYPDGFDSFKEPPVFG